MKISATALHCVVVCCLYCGAMCVSVPGWWEGSAGEEVEEAQRVHHRRQAAVL